MTRNNLIRKLENCFDQTEIAMNQMGKSLYSNEYDMSNDSLFSFYEEEDIKFYNMIQSVKFNFIKSIILDNDEKQLLLGQAKKTNYYKEIYSCNESRRKERKFRRVIRFFRFEKYTTNCYKKLTRTECESNLFGGSFN